MVSNQTNGVLGDDECCPLAENRIPIIAMIDERSGKAKKESRVEGPVWSFDAHCASHRAGGTKWRAHMGTTLPPEGGLWVKSSSNWDGKKSDIENVMICLCQTPPPKKRIYYILLCKPPNKSITRVTVRFSRGLNVWMILTAKLKGRKSQVRGKALI